MQNKRNIFYSKLNYRANNDNFFTVALTHRSFGNPNNERLEFLGDSILNFLIGKFLFEKFPEASEGELSQLRANLVKEDTLAKIALDLSLHDQILLGAGETKTGGNKRKSILADALEACIAAIYLDSSIETCEKIIAKIYFQELENLTLELPNKDYKTQLQELLQSTKNKLPKYTIIKTSGNPHDQTFYISCEIENPILKTEAHAKTKRKAEQEAAKKLLNIIQNHEN